MRRDWVVEPEMVLMASAYRLEMGNTAPWLAVVEAVSLIILQRLQACDDGLVGWFLVPSHTWFSAFRRARYRRCAWIAGPAAHWPSSASTEAQLARHWYQPTLSPTCPISLYSNCRVPRAQYPSRYEIKVSDEPPETL